MLAVEVWNFGLGLRLVLMAWPLIKGESEEKTGPRRSTMVGLRESADDGGLRESAGGRRLEKNKTQNVGPGMWS